MKRSAGRSPAFPDRQMTDSFHMDAVPSLPLKPFWQKDSFRFIRPQQFEALGIHPTDIPPGTFPARKHPSHLPSRFGGNAYGFGLFEIYDRLKPKDIQLLQSITFDDSEDIRKHYQAINEIYAHIGLLIRFSSHGKPYYLIPVHLASETLTHTKSKADEITKIVGFHRKKYLKEYHDIGLITPQDALISQVLSYRFKEHNFIAIDSIEKLRELNQTLDLVIIPRDLCELVLMENFNPLSSEMPSATQVKQYAVYFLWKIYDVLKPDGEIFVISDTHIPKTNRTTEITFRTLQEEKNFFLFTHIFKTRKKYRPGSKPLLINIFDFQKYLSGFYVEQEVVDRMLGEKDIAEMTLEQINRLPYLNFPLVESTFQRNQEKTWSELCSNFFDKIFLKPLVPVPIRDDWEKRFSSPNYSPKYMLIYLGQKRPVKYTRPELMREAAESHLLGCPQDLLADYRNDFNYVIQTLRVLEKLKNGTYRGVPEVFIDRLRQPLVNKNRRFSALNTVIRLIRKVRKLEKIRNYLNPGGVEGSRTRVLENLDALTLFGFSREELTEIIYIVFGHTSLGRIISGKMSEKAFKPVLDLANTFEQQQAVNFLRYCRLLTMAESEAARGTHLTREQIAELFDFYESAVRVVTSRELNWYDMLDERTAAIGGIQNKVIRKILKMMNHYEFIDNWAELGQKGRMEKEFLADYDDLKIQRIENVIRLVNTVKRFEKDSLRSDPLELPSFYRKILDMEYHGTGDLFERMDSDLVFILLSIATNLSQGDIINFNPLLGDIEPSELDEKVRRIEREARGINLQYVDFDVLHQFREQLDRYGSSFVLGTGFQIKTDPQTQVLEIYYTDVDRAIERLASMLDRIAGGPISGIPVEDLSTLQDIFSDLESFYQSHLRYIEGKEYNLKLPAIQRHWFQKIQKLRQMLRSNFLSIFFRPEEVHTNLDLLYHQAPAVLDFILPEFTALQDQKVPWHLYMTAPVTHYILAATKKLQALVNHSRKDFQDVRFLYRLAQREFGPLATGTVGVNDSQIRELENIVDKIAVNKPLLDALIKALIFQDLGRLPALREKYKADINPAELAQASAVFIEKEGIAENYGLDEKGKEYLVFLVRHHSLLHHMLRGEYSTSAIKDVLVSGDKSLFDAFFVFSFIMLSAIRDDLILEDLASQLFRIRDRYYEIIDGKTSLEERMNERFIQKGNLFFALEAYQKEGLPQGIASSHYLESTAWSLPARPRRIQAGKTVFALERIFRLRGIRYVQYEDIIRLIIKVPWRYIYKKKKLASIGYAKFEKELFEAFRIYNTIQALPDKAGQFLLDRLVEDRARIFGYEKVSNYLSYENQIKLLLLGLLGIDHFLSGDSPVCLNFLPLCEKIERRYEAVNDHLNTLSTDRLLSKEHLPAGFFKADTGIILRKETFPNVCSIDFQDTLNIAHKISHMAAINDVEQLKNYFHTSLRSLNMHPFHTDDYEKQLEEAYKKRLDRISDMILNQAKKQMDLVRDFEELHNLVSDILERSVAIGFSDDQRHRLTDLYELRKDSLKGEKLTEIEAFLGNIRDINEIRDYWESIKWYLQNNRRFLGKEFENTVAKKFDEAAKRVA